jgi:hypothetical protein
MEWIDEEEQRRKHAAQIVASSSSASAAQFPATDGPVTIDDFMSQWLHPNWSHVSCVEKMHISLEQVQPTAAAFFLKFLKTISQRKSRGEGAIDMPLSQPVLAPEGKQLFLIFVDGGPQPPRTVTAWKMATPGQAVADAGELSGHIDVMIRQGVQQRVVSAGGSMQSIDLRSQSVTNLTRGFTSRLIPEKSHANVPPRPYKCV